MLALTPLCLRKLKIGPQPVELEDLIWSRIKSFIFQDKFQILTRAWGGSQDAISIAPFYCLIARETTMICAVLCRRFQMMVPLSTVVTIKQVMLRVTMKLFLCICLRSLRTLRQFGQWSQFILKIINLTMSVTLTLESLILNRDKNSADITCQTTKME